MWERAPGARVQADGKQQMSQRMMGKKGGGFKARLFRLTRKRNLQKKGKSENNRRTGVSVLRRGRENNTKGGAKRKKRGRGHRCPTLKTYLIKEERSVDGKRTRVRATNHMREIGDYVPITVLVREQALTIKGINRSGAA